ncbi:TraB/GumN family protein [Rugamonas sp.]|uniref:TraB/GumN family protein n=1 Tax=Rugamonas sp. TaxID=1926287 RepID=UPI0025F04A8C|nr:TraB/GumN family protein [Rugamonas sp.]
MRRQIIVMFCGLFCLAFDPARAAEPPLPVSVPAVAAAIPNHGALFKITQDGSAHTLYLFGTIHVGAADFYPLEPRLSAALKKATVLALEIDPLGDANKMARAMQQYGMAHHGDPTPAQLPPAYRAQLDALLRKFAIPPETAAALQPWMLASVLTVSEFSAQGYDTAQAVDAWLAKQAHARHQRVLELESVAAQMALFSHLSADEQLLFLKESIDSIDDHEQADQARQIAQAWRDADIAALDALAQKAADDDTFSGRFVQKILLDGRNPGLAENIAKLLARENNSVAAIGVLHLVGVGSVPEWLRKRGLAVERIY